jgi:hypothetical protein
VIGGALAVSLSLDDVLTKNQTFVGTTEVNSFWSHKKSVDLLHIEQPNPII